jgi:hypothetical protein
VREPRVAGRHRGHPDFRHAERQRCHDARPATVPGTAEARDAVRRRSRGAAMTPPPAMSRARHGERAQASGNRHPRPGNLARNVGHGRRRAETLRSGSVADSSAPDGLRPCGFSRGIQRPDEGRRPCHRFACIGPGLHVSWKFAGYGYEIAR